MAVTVRDELGGILGPGRPWTQTEVGEALAGSASEMWAAIEGGFGRAGWYDASAAPYDAPSVAVAARQAANPPVVDAIRRLWLARYNPADPDFDVPDIDDDTKFPWRHPEAAPRDGWWLSSTNTPAGRDAIAEITTGDLVICQRTDPKGERDPADTRRDDMLVGIATVGLVDSWDDAHTGRREYAACMVPLTRFRHPVPRRTARRHHRLDGPSFRAPRQLPGRRGKLGFGLSYVDWADAVELLSVCGIPPQVLAEPDTACLAARLQATDTGNETFLRLRYDAQLRHQVRRAHERLGERAAEAWAAANGYVKRAGYQHVPLAGFDLLFLDAVGTELQVEVKGYMARKLAAVHLQPSQAWRATDAAAGHPPDWRLFALLGAGSKSPTETVLSPAQLVALLGVRGIQVKGGWPAPRPGSPWAAP